MLASINIGGIRIMLGEHADMCDFQARMCNRCGLKLKNFTRLLVVACIR